MAQLRGLPPEILELIGNLITTVSDIKALVLTSRWCNKQFRYLLWRQVRVTSNDHIQFATSLKTRARAIRSLRFENKVAQKFYDLHLPRLQTFRQDFPDRMTEPDTVKARACLLSFIRRHGKSLQGLTITTGHLHLNHKFWLTVFTALHTVKRLKIEETGSGQGIKPFEGATGNAFWRALTRFEEIEYKGKDQSGTLGPMDLDYSRLQRLTYIVKRSMKNNSGFWEWLSRCSNLRQLHLQGGMTISEVISTVQQLWPLLEDLSLKGVQGSDEQSATLFQHLQPLKHLSLAGGVFGSACFVQVRARHFESLRTLALRECEHFNSQFALLALIHCPHLEILEARRIAVQDIWSSPQSWACRRLRRLLITIESDPKDRGADMLFFEQLSRLTRLEQVEVGGDGDGLYALWGPGGQPSPRWRLDSGLSLLSNLTRLNLLNLNGTNQALRFEDVRWMLDHWPVLEQVVGKFALDSRMDAELKALIRLRGVQVL